MNKAGEAGVGVSETEQPRGESRGADCLRTSMSRGLTM